MLLALHRAMLLCSLPIWVTGNSFVGVTHNAANANLWKGLTALGVDVEEMPRNCANSQGCGHCPHGCAGLPRRLPCFQKVALC